MKKIILVVAVALALTASIASAGIVSLANGAAVLINASSHQAFTTTLPATVAGAASAVPAATDL
jgi:hypothetical protein